MFYLGVNPCIEGLNYHNPSVAVVANNQILFATEEERFNRIKGSPGRFPRCALQHSVIHFIGEEPYELVIPFSPDERLRRTCIEVRNDLQRIGLLDLIDKKDLSDIKYFDIRTTLVRSAQALLEYQEIYQLWSHQTAINSILLNYFGNVKKPSSIKFVEHHLAHAAGAYLQSPFESAVAVVADGVGEFACSSIWDCNRDAITCLSRTDFPNSLGYFYAAVTAFLGFSPWQDEGKTMALAPYGRIDANILRRFQREFLGSVHYDFSPLVNKCCGRGFSLEVEQAKETIANMLDIAPRSPSSEITSVYKSVAAVTQEILEAELLVLIREAVEISGNRQVCLSGGVFYNCKANSVIRRRGNLDGLFVQPVCGDAGTALGAAQLLNWQQARQKPPSLFSLALGRSPELTVIRHQLEEWHVPFSEIKKPESFLADRIATGNIVMWFQGAAEFGPRALGQRSIFADPRQPEIAKRINRTIKGREVWRPFASTIAIEQADEILENLDLRTPPRFMVEAYQVRHLWRERIPAVIHPSDGSTRPQVVSAESHPKLYALLHYFFSITGIPVLLNTSFNQKDEPLVDDLVDVLRVFHASGAEILAIDDLILTKN